MTRNKDVVVDCHYCYFAVCEDSNSRYTCFIHDITDSKKDAEECGWFVFYDIFPKFERQVNRNDYV